MLKLSSVHRFLEGGWNPVPVLLQEFSTREESFIKAKASARIFFMGLCASPEQDCKLFAKLYMKARKQDCQAKLDKLVTCFGHGHLLGAAWQ